MFKLFFGVFAPMTQNRVDDLRSYDGNRPDFGGSSRFPRLHNHLYRVIAAESSRKKHRDRGAWRQVGVLRGGEARTIDS
jgi:hypothetical protein